MQRPDLPGSALAGCLSLPGSPAPDTQHLLYCPPTSQRHMWERPAAGAASQSSQGMSPIRARGHVSTSEDRWPEGLEQKPSRGLLVADALLCSLLFAASPGSRGWWGCYPLRSEGLGPPTFLLGSQDRTGLMQALLCRSCHWRSTEHPVTGQGTLDEQSRKWQVRICQKPSPHGTCAHTCVGGGLCL